jgi:hypothetical protein
MKTTKTATKTAKTNKNVATFYSINQRYLITLDNLDVKAFHGSLNCTDAELYGFTYTEDTKADAKSRFIALCDEKRNAGLSETAPTSDAPKCVQVVTSVKTRNSEDEVLRAKAQQLFAKNWAIKDIALELGRAQSTTWRWIHSAKVA